MVSPIPKRSTVILSDALSSAEPGVPARPESCVTPLAPTLCGGGNKQTRRGTRPRVPGIFAIGIATLLLFFTAAFADNTAVIERASREIIVKWKTAPRSLDVTDLLPEQADKILTLRKALPVDRRAPELNKITVLEARDQRSAESLISELSYDPRIEWAERRPIRHTDACRRESNRNRGSLDVIPNDPFYNLQWGLQAVDAEAAWMAATGSPDVAIAVVDVGVFFDHPELQESRWENTAEVNGLPDVDDDGNGYIDDLYGFDFMDMDGDPVPDPLEPAQSHGTHVAGIAAAARNNGRGIAGIASGCRIMNVRAGAGNSIPFGYEGIIYACKSGARIINCSWGGNSDSAYELEIIRFAHEQGCVVIAAAGNDNVIDPHYPAAIEGVLGVAATRMGDFAAPFTHFGPWVTLSAPGVNILSTVFGDGGSANYSAWQGTSMSAPLVSGICGLVASRYPSMDGRQIASRVISSSEPIDNLNPHRDGYLGLGRVNAWRAVADDLQGLRIGGISFVETIGVADGRVLPGETAELTVSVFNDLDPAQGVIGVISTTADTLIIGTNFAVYGDIGVGGPFTGLTPFQLTLPFESPRGRTIPLTLDWTRFDGRLLGRTTINLEIDTTYAIVDNGRLSLGFAENGSLGLRDYRNNLTLGPGLRIAGRPTHALFHGTFLLGADGQVADNGYGDAERTRYDWESPAGVYARHIISERADIEVRAEFRDRGSAVPEYLVAHVEAAALAWNADNLNDFLLLEYTVTNESVNPWNETYVGFFMDWDLGPAAMNRGGYDPAGRLTYVEQLLPDYPLVGVASVTDPLTAVYTIDNREELDSPETWNDDRKWELLTGGIGEDILDERDVSQLIAVGPFTFEAHETRTFAFALIAGESKEELREVAETARETYLPPATREEPAPVTRSVKTGIVPNPLRNGEMKLLLPHAELATVRFYNVLGRQIGQINDVRGGPSGVTIDRNVLGSASGLILYQIEVNGKQTFGKLVVLR